MDYTPKPEHRFTFGLWTVGNIGGDAFGQPVRRKLSPVEIVYLLAEVGAYGVNPDTWSIGPPHALTGLAHFCMPERTKNMPRDVSDAEGVTWTCIQAFAGLGNDPEKADAARVESICNQHATAGTH